MVQDPGLLVAYLPFALWSPHFETELEIVQKHIESGGRALVLSCQGKLTACNPNPGHNPIICGLCRTRFEAGIRWLRGGSVSIAPFYLLTAHEKSLVEALERKVWRDLAEVRSFTINEADIGMAALSSVISILREPQPDLAIYQKMIQKHISAAATVYYSIRNRLKAIRPDHLLLFNGRLSAMRPALRAAQEIGVQTSVEERAGELNRYRITENTYPHDLPKAKVEIAEFYDHCELPEEEKHRLAEKWFEECRRGQDKSWHAYVKEQKNGCLPEGFSDAVTNIVIFNTSEDEYVTIREWQNPFYSTQNEGIARLMDDVGDLDGVRVFLRVHPHLKGVDNSQTRGIEALSKRYLNLHVIPADSKVSTYSLIDAADVVVIYASTVGVEAAYAGKLSVLMGRALYEDLGVCEKPGSHEAFVSLLREIVNGKWQYDSARYRLGALKYGLYAKMFGNEFTYVRPDGIFSASMVRDGAVTTFKPKTFYRVLYRLYREFTGKMQ